MDSYKPQPPTTRDVEKIFSKLEDDKVLEKINDLYFKAFVDSSKTILEGLIDNNEELASDPKVKGYHENALALFKNKFTLASHVMIETMFNHVLSKRSPRQEPRKSLNIDRSSINRSDLDLIESQREKEDEVSTQSISRDQIDIPTTPKPKTLTKSQKALKVATSPLKKWKKKETSPSNAKEVKELTYVLRRTPQKKPDNTTIPNSHRTFNNSAKPKSPLSQALSSRSPSRMQSFLSTACTIKNNSTFHDKSMTTPLGSQCPSQTFLNQTALNQTMPLSPTGSARRQTNPNHSVSFVQSEFNYVRGPATFGHSPRSSWVDAVARTDSPGPGKYDPKLRNNSPSPSIGRAPRVSWIDAVARTDSPGPGAYNVVNTNSSPRLSIGKAPKVSWIDAVSRTESPGPGAYETPNTNTSPRLSIGRAPRVSWIDVIARTESPGPGKYEVSSTNNSPRVSIGKAPKIPWIDIIARNDSPGPAKYNPRVRSGSPSPSIGKAPKVCWVDEVARNDSPGPASYYPSMHFVSK